MQIWALCEHSGADGDVVVDGEHGAAVVVGEHCRDAHDDAAREHLNGPIGEWVTLQGTAFGNVQGTGTEIGRRRAPAAGGTISATMRPGPVTATRWPAATRRMYLQSRSLELQRW